MGIFFLILACLLILFVVLFLTCRKFACYTSRCLLHLRYKVHISGQECLSTDHAQLILPNHVAVVDPMLLFAEFYNWKIQPLVDEGYFQNPALRQILSLFDSICVPDLRKNRHGLDQIKHLDGITVDALKEGKTVLFYPSGHITLSGVEEIGSRHLCYNVINNLPENCRVIAVTTRGLWGSSTSRKGQRRTPPIGATLFRNLYKLFTPRRQVYIHLEDITELTHAWSRYEKMEFNKALENYYNSTIDPNDPTKQA